MTQGSETDQKKKAAITFPWDREDLVLNNTHTLLQKYHMEYAFFGFHMQLALAMNWIVAYQVGNVWRPALGPNLLISQPQGMPLPMSAETMWGG